MVIDLLIIYYTSDVNGDVKFGDVKIDYSGVNSR